MAMLSAADSVSFKTKKWCYPFFGCFPLRSYYKIEDAQRAGERLLRKGYEINIDKIDGFSTLGVFSDPIFSFMSEYSVFTVAQFIFHEQTHATVYFGKSVQFSEELATFIGREGALHYLKTYYGSSSPEYLQAKDFIADQETYLKLLRELYGRLGKLYNQNINRKEKLARKREYIENLKRHLGEDYDTLFSTEWYRGVDKLPFNNAFLAVRMTYTLDLKLFDRFYEKHQKSLREVVKFATSLKKRKGNPKEHLEKEVDSRN
jgi:predicted aminopeptidase